MDDVIKRQKVVPYVTIKLPLQLKYVLELQNL